MPKSFFIGNIADNNDDPEFYMRNTVVDVPYGAAQDGLFTATYAQPTNRIKWEVQERALIARSTFERIQDSDNKGNRRTKDGQVVAMFAIESHFDIRRDYNPGTGEESNTIVENASDRPWYQREFMRVDWSRNLVTDGYEVDTLSQLGLYGGVKFDPVSYKVEDPNDPNAPAFAPEEGYFDVAAKAFATPQMVDTPWGAFPACFFFGVHPAGNCNPTELTLRLSFKKVTETDYEPSDWDGTRMDSFGAFYASRYGYERNYGILDQNWHRLAAKYNMFERNHISQKSEGGGEVFAQCNVDYWRDENGDIQKFRTNASGAIVSDPTTGLPIPDPNGKPLAGSSVAAGQARNANRWKILDQNENKTDDECEFKDSSGKLLHQGSRCDTLARRCTLPLHERKVKTIPWYYGGDGPADLFPSTAAATEQWNVAAKQALQAGMKVDAQRVGADASKFITDEEQIAKRDGAAKDLTEVFVLCHSPVLETDHKACGKPGTIARIGDLRYNSVNIINTPQDPSPWGIMVDGDDPLTGEKVNTSVNEWGHILDIISQSTVDYIKWVNGEISDEAITGGQYMLDWTNGSKFAAKATEQKVLSEQEVQTRLASVLSADGNGNFYKRNVLHKGDQLPMAEMLGKLKAQGQARKKSGVPLDRDAEIEARRKQLVGSKFEAMLATKEMQVMAGIPANRAGQISMDDDSMLSRVSPLRGQNPQMRRWLENLKNQRAHEHANCTVEAPLPDATGIVGLARQAKTLYPLPAADDADFAAKKVKRDRDMFQWIREQFHISVILHEMGHSMGLRHNFVGNFDALNFHTQYWQLRTRNGKEKACEAEGGGIGGARSFKPHTNGEDCVGGRWFDPITETEQNGILPRWGSSTVMDYPGDYSQDMNGLGKYDKAWMRFMYADVVDVDVDSNTGKKQSYYPFMSDRNSGGVLGPFLMPSYWKLNDMFNLVGECSDQTDSSNPLSAKCSGYKLDFRKIYDMQDASGTTRTTDFGAIGWSGNFNRDADGYSRHPYMFSSDEFADGGNVSVYRHDAGADLYEQAQYFINSYENRYVWDNFRRNRVMFNVGGTVNRTLARYFDKMTATTKAMGLILDGGPGDGQYLGHEELLLTHALASSMGFEEFIKVLTRPEPGAYRFARSRDLTDTCTNKSYAEVAEYYADDLCNPNERETTPPAFTLKVGQGVRYMHNEYDYSKGYEWSDYLRWVGSYYEKVYITYFLTEAYNNFLQNSRDDYVDGRDRNINYARIYPEQMRRLTASMMQNDFTLYAPYVLPQTSGFNTSADPVQWLPLDRFTANDPGTVSPSYPAGAVRINPLVGWEQQFPAIIFNYLYGSTTLNMDWNNQLRVWYPDSDGSLPVPLAEQIRYQDPISGVLYAARSYGKETIAGRQVQRATGSRMLQYANDFAATAFVTLSTDPVTGMHTYQKAGVANEPVCKTIPGVPTADQELACANAKKRIKYFSSNLDTMREIALYIQGPLSSR